jgi:hypothetical protein
MGLQRDAADAEHLRQLIARHPGCPDSGSIGGRQCQINRRQHAKVNSVPAPPKAKQRGAWRREASFGSSFDMEISFICGLHTAADLPRGWIIRAPSNNLVGLE